MKNNKLFSLLSKLSREEMRKFGIFLASPYHNTNKTLSKFHIYIEDIFPDFPEKKLTKETIHKKLFLDKNFSSRRITDLCSDLSLLLENFMAYEELNKDKIEKKILFVKALSRHNIHPFFERETEKLEVLLKSEKKKDSRVFLRLHQLNANLYFHIDTPKRKAKEHLEEANDYLDAFFTFEKLKYIYELRQLDYNHIDLLYQKKAIINANLLRETSISFQLMALLPSLQKNGTQEIFNKIYELFRINLESIQKELKEVIVMALLNYTILNLPINKKSDQLKFELYKIGLKENSFTQNGKINGVAFYNISTIAVRTGNFLWAEKFNENYSEKLDISLRENLSLLTKAYYLFYKNKYREAINIIDCIDYTNFPFRRTSELLAIRTAYEIYMKDRNYGEVLEYRIEALKKTYYRNKAISNQIKSRVLNFLNFILQLTLILQNPNFSTSDKIKLKKKIEDTKGLEFKTYLLEKLKEIR